MGDASAEQATELSSAHAQVEAVELELAPLTVAAAGPAAVDLAAPAAELEHAPIIVEAAFEPLDIDAPAAEAEAASAPDLPGFDLMPEPTGTASAQPDPDPVAAAEQPSVLRSRWSRSSPLHARRRCATTRHRSRSSSIRSRSILRTPSRHPKRRSGQRDIPSN